MAATAQAAVKGIPMTKVKLDRRPWASVRIAGQVTLRGGPIPVRRVLKKTGIGSPAMPRLWRLVADYRTNGTFFGTLVVRMADPEAQ